MERSLLKTAIPLFFVTALAACGGGGGSDNDTSPDDRTTPSGTTPAEYADTIRSMDLSAAEGFIVTRQSGGKISSSSVDDDYIETLDADDAVDLEENSVYKVTTDGRLERVPVRDADNNEVPRGAVRPFSVKDINETFMVMTFWVPGLESGCLNGSDDSACAYEWEDGTQEPYSEDMVAYLVRKSDGLAFNATEALPVQIYSDWGSGGPSEVYTNISRIRFESDDLGNLYFAYQDSFSGANFLRRIDIGDIENGEVTARDLQTTDRILSFAPSSDGRFVTYVGESTQDAGQLVIRAEMMDGSGLINLRGSGKIERVSQYGDDELVYRMFDGTVYVLAAGPELGPRYTVYRVDSDAPGDVSVTDLGELELVTTSGGNFSFYPLPESVEDNYDRLVVDGREFITRNAAPIVEMDLGREDGNGNPAPRVTRHDESVADVYGAGFDSSIRQTRVSGRYAWYFGTKLATGGDVVLRYDPLIEEAEEFPTIVDPTTGSELDINDFRVLSSDKVWFEALRLGDQATVIGEISVDGNVTITDVVAADEPRSFVLQPIIPADFLVVDGRVNEWPLDFRLTNDNSDSGPAGNDISYYSQQTANGNYYGLVEFADTPDASVLTRVRINDGYELRIWPDSAELVAIDPATGLATGAPEDLTALGGAAAVGQAVEFRIPEAAVGSPADYSLEIARVGDGDIGSLTAEYDAGSTEHTLQVGLVTPLGDALLEIGLGNGYSLEIDQSETGPEVRIVDDSATSTVADNNGGDLSANPLIIVLNDADIANPGEALSLQEASQEEILDSVNVN